ncbi:DNA helicase [Bacillus licheniformis]|uniref:RNA polymerase recycling motor HelD n=1 Tax=Bacillus licheniformis TaxID=1402 RepID=UPI000F5FFC04|nr:RNA polymerase recycling motor HelD [Bacillus licheniformis]RRD95572.1 DNA helicase [Bacillus licheniformis]
MTKAVDHKAYIEEKKHLEFTKRYIEAVLKTAATSQSNFRQNIKDAFVDLDWLDSSLSYINILTNAKFLEMSNADIESLNRIKDKPYFARIDFSREHLKNKEVYYIGKTSLYQRESQDPIIVDWRSPVANLYYDGRLGEVEYQSGHREYKGYLSLKRQYIIEDGTLEEIRDVDLTARDELLQASLADSSSNRLTDIVSTIQEEQNKIIRSDLNRPIIVQGAAGSGKTTIALHRVSFFLYTYAEQFDPKKLMILAPNRLFIDYISEALPELGVQHIKQTTFHEFVMECIGKNLKLKPDMKLQTYAEGEDQEQAQKQISEFKGSFQLKAILDAYLKDILSEFVPKDDFQVDKFRIFRKKRFQTLLYKEYNYLPVYDRVAKIRRVISNDLRSKKKKMIEKVETFYDDKIEKAIYGMRDEKKRRHFVSRALDKKEARLEELQFALKSAVTNYFKQFPKKNLLTYYRELFNDAEQFLKYSGGTLSKEEAENICSYMQKEFKGKKCEVEDLGALLYLQTFLFGISDELKMKNVVIDEVQDYSYMQLLSLKAALETDMFTLVGDLAQGIHSYRSLKEWDQVQKHIFPRANYTELQKSYRTTMEIMYLANEILKLLPFDLPQVEPLVRHGEKPAFIHASDIQDLSSSVEKKILELIKSGLKTFAVIGKTSKDCKKIYDHLKHSKNLSFQLFDDEDRLEKEIVSILPSYLAKGLEFDAVFLISADEYYTAENELDVKLLYVGMTRPLHKLFLLGKTKKQFLLDFAKESLFEIKNN